MLTKLRALVAHVTTALADENITDVGVTVNSTELPGIVEAGALAVLVSPPSRTWHTYTHITDEFSVWVVAGSLDNIEGALDRMAPAIDAIALATSADTAEPTTFRDPHGTEWPAYIIKIQDA